MFREKKKKYRFLYKILIGTVIVYVAWFGLTFNARYKEYIAQKEYCKTLDLKYSSQTTMNIQGDEFHKAIKDIVDCAIFKSSNKFFPISLLF